MPVVPRIDYMNFGGIVAEGDDPAADATSWYIEDANSGVTLVDFDFNSEADAQAYLDMHRGELIARGLPPLDADQTRDYLKSFDYIAAQLDAGATSAKQARGLLKNLSRIEERCPDAAFRSRLAAILERLRKV